MWEKAKLENHNGGPFTYTYRALLNGLSCLFVHYRIFMSKSYSKCLIQRYSSSIIPFRYKSDSNYSSRDLDRRGQGKVLSSNLCVSLPHAKCKGI